MAEETEDGEGALYLPALFLKPPTVGGQPQLWTECQVQQYDDAENKSDTAALTSSPPLACAAPVQRCPLDALPRSRHTC